MVTQKNRTRADRRTRKHVTIKKGTDSGKKRVLARATDLAVELYTPALKELEKH